ncbi:MAG TPA: hypothetical protein VK741_21750 [Acetobacteraceae bacterium]|jgi:hypothetical protein|nr:hypothetical protein [Acetobacteraceae bacterium]
MSRRDLVGALTALVRLIDNADDLTSIRRGVLLGRARAVAAAEAAGPAPNLPWTPFAEVGHQRVPTTAQLALIQANMPGTTIAQARALYAASYAGSRMFVNSRYQVVVSEEGSNVHLSIKRLDQAPIHDWRDLQRIKDELLGVECEAIELYPADSRLVDTANQYHLWGVRDPHFRFPFGIEERMVLDDQSGPTQQRAREA